MADSSGYAGELAQFASAQNADDILEQTQSAKNFAERMHNVSVGELLISLGVPAGKALAKFAAARSPVVKKLLDAGEQAKDAVDGVQDSIRGAQDTVENTVNNTREALDDQIAEARQTATSAVSDAQDAASSAVSDAQGAVGDAVSDAQNAATTAVSDAQGAVGDAADTLNGSGSLLAEAADSPALSDFRSYSDIISQSETAAREPTLADLVNTGRTPVRSMERSAQDLIDDADPESNLMEGQIDEGLDPTIFTAEREPLEQVQLEDASAPADVEMQNMGAQQQESEEQPPEESEPSEPAEGRAPAETDAGEGVVSDAQESEAAVGVEAGEDVAEGAEGAGDAAGVLSGVASAEEAGGLLDAAGLPEVGLVVGAVAGLVSLGVGLKEIFDGGSHSAPPPPLAQAVYEPGAETSTA